MRRIVRGAADDSYGIEVAKLAGLPQAVTDRAKEVLRQLEASAPSSGATQLDFTSMDAGERAEQTPVRAAWKDRLLALDVETLTPLEALNFLYELKRELEPEQRTK